ncbi:EF-hand-like domain-containing protein [Cynara cardunculus var. scolymus]|uniref:non-specific serine/threonine protein kinase n=1 Tax=Cynara cardunculus var. scolymus TaxID=59895 RepID=A0A118K1C4_CYNCS|nr:EF-hand-like domain-containing protein [Cynara cardunculus var. scolymus]
MGVCSSKPSTKTEFSGDLDTNIPVKDGGDGASRETISKKDEIEVGKKTPLFPFYSPSPAHYLFSKKSSPAPNASSNSTPRRFFKRPFPPPSPAKHIKALARRHGSVKPNAVAIPEANDVERNTGLDKSFGFSKHFGNKYELGEEVGRGHFGHTCKAKFKKGEFKGQEVAVKVIPKSKMTTAIAIEDVRREVKILRALTGHNNLVKFYDAYEDHDNVYVVMELCEGGELLDRILSRYHVDSFHLLFINKEFLKMGGKYTEDDAKVVLIQILNVVAFCHLQGVVHRDLKPENFLFTSKDENSQLKAIDFGFAYYVAPEVLHRSYSTEADVWSIGVIAYILLCGSRPFWARTESGIFRAVLKAHPSFDEVPWPTLSSEAKDFVKRLLNKDPRKRMTAAQALGHPWIQNSNEVKVPLDVSILRHMKGYMQPTKNGSISMENIKVALMKHSTDAMKESRVHDFLNSYRRMEFDEFCAAAISVHQLEALDRWEQHARCAYELFDKDGNRPIMIEELASELGLGPSVSVHSVLHDWIRHTDGKLSFLGFVKLLHGVSSRTLAKAR